MTSDLTFAFFFMVFTFIIGVLCGMVMMREQAIKEAAERGFAEFCASTQEFEWTGDCPK